MNLRKERKISLKLREMMEAEAGMQEIKLMEAEKKSNQRKRLLNTLAQKRCVRLPHDVMCLYVLFHVVCLYVFLCIDK